jgi:hypothetical protein
MRRALIVRLFTLWIAFGLGTALGAWVVGRHAGVCSTRIVETNSDALMAAAQAALPAAVSGSGVVSFTLDPTGIRVHADSAFANQSYDTRVPALVRGSSMTVEVSSRLLSRMIAR